MIKIERNNRGIKKELYKVVNLNLAVTSGGNIRKIHRTTFKKKISCKLYKSAHTYLSKINFIFTTFMVFVVECGDCKHEKLVVFNCKRRGFCLSWGTRRMTISAELLFDDVLRR